MRASNSLTDEQRTFRRILLAKGPVVTPRKIQMSFHGRLKVSDVIHAMEQMSALGFGMLCQYESSSNKFFQKADPDHLDDKALLAYNVTAYEYRRNYFFRK
ncbi:hypothetical protein LSH36_375g02075 [Paralvinella palmiformis]|uniref:Uncharacterized protein n=1 Tax=Paralvinella palmiformis TaxID=53620 RepID=A0AAD9JDV1_9ANNE|nr:hypothetical protein LSH36_375g02075 [Paralvinella palmiformis]